MAESHGAPVHLSKNPVQEENRMAENHAGEYGLFPKDICITEIL